MYYRAFGLIFSSDVPLPEFSRFGTDCEVQSAPPIQPDVVIEVGAFLSPEWVKSALLPGAPVDDLLNFSASRAQILISGVGRFTVTDGAHVLIEPLKSRGPSTWRLPLLGSVLALLLEQRGLFVLHAGAVDVGGFAAAFLGEKGQGKSTLNAALAQSGFPLLSDDVVALMWPRDDKTELPLALSGFAQIKLVPDAARAVLGGDPENWPAVAPELNQIDKRSFMAPLAPRSLPLRHVFVLDSPESAENGGDDIQLIALSPQDALIQLMPHTFAARFGELYLHGDRKKTHFKQCARLVSACRVWKLSRRRDLALLPATLDCIAKAVGTSVGAASQSS